MRVQDKAHTSARSSPCHTKRWKSLRLRVFRRDGYRCKICGRAGRLECDHVVNMKDGGATWNMRNLQSLCRGCHIKKTRSENRSRYVQTLDPKRAAWEKLVNELASNAP